MSKGGEDGEDELMPTKYSECNDAFKRSVLGGQLHGGYSYQDSILMNCHVDPVEPPDETEHLFGFMSLVFLGLLSVPIVYVILRFLLSCWICARLCCCLCHCFDKKGKRNWKDPVKNQKVAEKK